MYNLPTFQKKARRDDSSQPSPRQEVSQNGRTTVLLTIILLPLLFGVTHLVEGEVLFTGELDTSVEITPLESGPIEDFDSDLTLSYETEFLTIESETELEMDGFAGGAVSLEVDFDSSALKGEIEFGDEAGEFEEFTGKASLALDEGTEVGLDLDADYEVEEERGYFELEWDLEVERELPCGSEVELGLNFSPEEENYPLPEEVTLEVDEALVGDVELKSSVEVTEGELAEIEIDFELLEPVYTAPELLLEGSVLWTPDEKYIEIAPELDLPLGTLSVDGVLTLHGGTLIQDLELLNVGLKDLEVFGSRIDLEFEIDDDVGSLKYNKEVGETELTLEAESNYASSRSLFGLSEFSGEVTWEPLDWIELEIALESGTDAFPEEITLTSVYSF